MEEWPSGQWQQTVNLPSYEFEGSNPSSSTIYLLESDMAKHLNHIQIKDHKVLPDFEWVDIPKLAVITGVNGAGKTLLLTAIYNKIQHPGTLPTVVIPDIPLFPQVGYVSWQQNLGHTGTGSYHNQQEDLNALINDLRQNRPRDNDHRKQIIEVMKEDIGPDLLQKDESFYKDEKFLDSFRKAWIYKENIIAHEHISKLFITYLVRETQYIRANRDTNTGCSPTGIQIAAHLGETPWGLINKLFEQYKFEYRIDNPTDPFLNYNAAFYKLNSPSVKIGFGQLSSGEQMIVSLILWSYSQDLAKRKSILFLDEI